MRHGGHLVAHVLGGFLKPFLGHALFPPLEVPRRIGDAPPGGPCGSFQTGQRVLADLLRQCPGNIQKAPGGLAGDLGNPLRERLGLGLPGPVVPSPAHKGVDVRLLIPGKPHVLHFAVHTGVCPPSAPEEGTKQSAADGTKDGAYHGHHGTQGRPGRKGRPGHNRRPGGKRTKAEAASRAEPCGKPAILALRKPKRPAKHGVTERTEPTRHEIGGNGGQECPRRGRGGRSRAGYARLQKFGSRRFHIAGRGGEQAWEPSGHRIVDGVPDAGKPRPRHEVTEAGKIADAAHPARAARRLRHTARAKHTRHHARNLNRDGPGDRHMHQIRKERREQRLKGRQRHLPIFQHLLPDVVEAGVHAFKK